MGGPAVDAAGDQVLDSVRAVTGRVARGTWIRVEIWAKDSTTPRSVGQRSTVRRPLIRS